MEKLIATCGLVCSECPSYIATRNGDSATLESLAKTWSVEYEATLSAQDCTCNGCHSHVGPWMAHCALCEIRACGTEKAVENCSECAEYACEKLVQFFEVVPDAKTLLDGLRGSV